MYLFLVLAFFFLFVLIVFYTNKGKEKEDQLTHQTVEEDMCTAAFIDVETTGLSNRDEIIELAVALIEFDPDTGEVTQILDSYSGLREPSVSIEKGAANIHGISRSELKGKRIDLRRVSNLLLQANFFVAHNAPFDRRFLKKLIPEVESATWLCTMNGIDWKSKGFESKSLKNLITDHNIAQEQIHRAEQDVVASIDLVSKKNKEGKTYLHELIINHFKEES